MKDYKNILKIFSPPFNIHVLNILNTLNNDGDIIDEEVVRKIKTSFSSLCLSDKVYHSDQFHELSIMFLDFKNRLKESETLKIPDEVLSYLNGLSNLIDVCKTSTTDNKEYDTIIEEFETLMDNLQNVDLSVMLHDIRDDFNIAKIKSSLIDVSAGIYGIMSAITISSTWNELISNYESFKEEFNLNKMEP